MDVDISPKFLKRWAKMYVDKALDGKEGGTKAKEWAKKTLKSPEIIKQIAPYVQQEYKKRGVNF